MDGVTAGEWEPGMRREEVPLPPHATNDDLEWHLIYDSGKRRIGDFYSVQTFQKYVDCELRQWRCLAPAISLTFLDSSADWWLRSDGAAVIQFWDRVPGTGLIEQIICDGVRLAYPSWVEPIIHTQLWKKENGHELYRNILEIDARRRGVS